jgi:hypothetical protein
MFNESSMVTLLYATIEGGQIFFLFITNMLNPKNMSCDPLGTKVYDRKTMDR